MHALSFAPSLPLSFAVELPSALFSSAGAGGLSSGVCTGVEVVLGAAEVVRPRLGAGLGSGATFVRTYVAAGTAGEVDGPGELASVARP